MSRKKTLSYSPETGLACFIMGNDSPIQPHMRSSLVAPSGEVDKSHISVRSAIIFPSQLA
jgi:hypothetical protein